MSSIQGVSKEPAAYRKMNKHRNGKDSQRKSTLGLSFFGRTASCVRSLSGIRCANTAGPVVTRTDHFGVRWNLKLSGLYTSPNVKTFKVVGFERTLNMISLKTDLSTQHVPYVPYRTHTSASPFRDGRKVSETILLLICCPFI